MPFGRTEKYVSQSLSGLFWVPLLYDFDDEYRYMKKIQLDPNITSQDVQAPKAWKRLGIEATQRAQRAGKYKVSGPRKLGNH